MDETTRNIFGNDDSESVLPVDGDLSDGSGTLSKSDSDILREEVAVQEMHAIHEVVEAVMRARGWTWNDILPPGALATAVGPAREALVDRVLAKARPTTWVDRANMYADLVVEELILLRQRNYPTEEARGALMSLLPDQTIGLPAVRPPFSGERVA